MNPMTKIPNSAYMKKQKKGKDITPATIGSLNQHAEACQAISPTETPVSAYTFKQKQGKNVTEAYAGQLTGLDRLMAIDPASVPVKKYTKKQPK